MAFDVELCYNTEPLCKIKKNITTLTTVSGTIRDETSIADPIILIEGNLSSLGFNYMHISSFQRYYYVTDIVSVRNGLWEVHSHCDVLKTYADAILANKGVISRQENEWNMYLNDGTFKSYQNPLIETREFASGFADPCYIMILGCPVTTSF